MFLGNYPKKYPDIVIRYSIFKDHDVERTGVVTCKYRDWAEWHHTLRENEYVRSVGSPHLVKPLPMLPPDLETKLLCSVCQKEATDDLLCYVGERLAFVEIKPGIKNMGATIRQIRDYQRGLGSFALAILFTEDRRFDKELMAASITPVHPAIAQDSWFSSV